MKPPQAPLDHPAEARRPEYGLFGACAAAPRDHTPAGGKVGPMKLRLAFHRTLHKLCRSAFQESLRMLDERPLDPDQCRAARALVGWSRADLAERSGVAATTLAHFEAGKRDPYPRTLADVRRTLEAAGVIFISADEVGGAGVRRTREAAVA